MTVEALADAIRTRASAAGANLGAAEFHIIHADSGGILFDDDRAP